MTTIFLLSLVGAVIYAVIGTFWYSNKTPMGKIHLRYLGFDKLSKDEQKRKIEKAKPTMWKMYLGQIVLSFLTSFAVVFVVVMSMQSGVSLSLVLMFVTLIWLCFMVPVIGSGVIWSNCDKDIVWKKFFSDIFSNLVTILIIGYLASLFA